MLSGNSIEGAYSIQEPISRLKRPRLIMMLIMAGQPIDEVIDALLLHIQAGDIITDGGNSYFSYESSDQVLGRKGYLLCWYWCLRRGRRSPI